MNENLLFSLLLLFFVSWERGKEFHCLQIFLHFNLKAKISLLAAQLVTRWELERDNLLKIKMIFLSYFHYFSHAFDHFMPNVFKIKDLTDLRYISSHNVYRHLRWCSLFLFMRVCECERATGMKRIKIVSLTIK
jgi:hypothetical protein